MNVSRGLCFLKSIIFPINSSKNKLPLAYLMMEAKRFKCDGNVKCNPENIVWIDCEMTGLNIETDKLLEVACIVTDKDLNILEDGIDFVLHQPDSILNNMHEWCVNQHGLSGLTDAVKNSKISTKEAELKLISFIEKYTPPGKCPLAGNSIHCDREFLKKEMPNLINLLSYRIIDVSSLKELCKRWSPDILENIPHKERSHRALDDIKESIEELKYYRKMMFDTK